MCCECFEQLQKWSITGCFCFLIQLLIRMKLYIYIILCSLVFNKFYHAGIKSLSWYWFCLCFTHELLMSFWIVIIVVVLYCRSFYILQIDAVSLYMLVLAQMIASGLTVSILSQNQLSYRVKKKALNFLK